MTNVTKAHASKLWAGEGERNSACVILRKLPGGEEILFGSSFCKYLFYENCRFCFLNLS